MAYKISDDCVMCGACAEECPVNAISEGEGKYVIDADTCIDCGACGAPNCRAFAEDVVRGQAQPHECVVAMRQTIQTYAEQMQLSQPCTPPPEEQPKKEDLP